MRLLDARTLELKTFVDNIPPYAILSHCWTDDEVVFSDLADLEQASKKTGFAKIVKTCELAIGDELDFAWIDTCCIDKSSSTELSEAINSMFAWYRNSQQCYAYLADVELEVAITEIGRKRIRGTTFAQSKWFRRAWTLQELLAPSNSWTSRDEGMKFYSRDWQLLGSKATIGGQISEITGIPVEYLEGQSLESASISMRMSWAADRQATRSEDIAYSLLGIFDVNMPLLYGEGRTKAFRRLQEEIMKISEDETLFAWETVWPIELLTAGVLATRPDDFQSTRDLIPFASDDPVPPHIITHRGLRIWQTLFHNHQLDKYGREMLRSLQQLPGMSWSGHDIIWGILRCHVVHDFQHFIIVPLRYLSADVYLRDHGTSVSLIPFGCVPPSAFTREIYIRNTRASAIQKSVRRRWGFLIRNPLEDIEIRQCYPKDAWNKKDNILQSKDNETGTSSWHASLELNFSLTTKTGHPANYMMFLSIGCKYDNTVKKPQPWCHINDAVWPQGTKKLEAYHAIASSLSPRNEVRRFRAGELIRTNLSLKVSITPTKILSQDMFVVDFHHAEVQQHYTTAALDSQAQLLPHPASDSSPPMYGVFRS